MVRGIRIRHIDVKCTGHRWPLLAAICQLQDGIVHADLGVTDAAIRSRMACNFLRIEDYFQEIDQPEPRP
jgi:hypothetical protein